jgi:hypothetical protein
MTLIMLHDISLYLLDGTDVTKPGIIPVVSATMGEAVHLVCIVFISI